ACTRCDARTARRGRRGSRRGRVWRAWASSPAVLLVVAGGDELLDPRCAGAVHGGLRTLRQPGTVEDVLRGLQAQGLVVAGRHDAGQGRDGGVDELEEAQLRGALYLRCGAAVQPAHRGPGDRGLLARCPGPGLLPADLLPEIGRASCRE